MNERKGSQGKIPSQAVVKHRENVSQITSRSGKELQGPPSIQSRKKNSKNESEGMTTVPRQNVFSKNSSKNTISLTSPVSLLKEKEVEEEIELEKHPKDHACSFDTNIGIPPPFPRRLQKMPREDPMYFMSIFEKLEINIPFLQVIKLSDFNKFFKDFIAGKSKKVRKIFMGQNVSAVIQKNLSLKCKDPVMLSLP